MTTRRHGFHIEDSTFDTVKSAALTAVFWYVGLLVVGALLAPYPFPSAMFALIQILLLMGDLGEAQNSQKHLAIFIGAFFNFLIGAALHDPIVWGFAILVMGTAIAKALKLD